MHCCRSLFLSTITAAQAGDSQFFFFRWKVRASSIAKCALHDYELFSPGTRVCFFFIAQSIVLSERTVCVSRMCGELLIEVIDIDFNLISGVVLLWFCLVITVCGVMRGGRVVGTDEWEQRMTSKIRLFCLRRYHWILSCFSNDFVMFCTILFSNF